jgi:DNA-binding transcriptional MocR family regulator
MTNGSPTARAGPAQGAKKAPSFRSVWERQIREAGLARGEGKVSVLAVALVMATFANPDGTRVFPGEQRLADGIGVSRSTVTRALARLRREGWVEKIREGNSRSGQADEYRLRLPDRASPMSDRASSPPVRGSWARAARVAGDSPPGQEPRQNHHTTTTSTETAADPTSPWAGLDERALRKPLPKSFVLPSEIEAEEVGDEVDWEAIERRVEQERTLPVRRRGSRYVS